jgi:exodeoxyribonuclease VII small subunit
VAGVSEASQPAADAAAAPGYEAARDELLDIVGRLEAGGLSLEASLQLWERGEYLARVCERWLDAAEQRLDAARDGDAPG